MDQKIQSPIRLLWIFSSLLVLGFTMLVYQRVSRPVSAPLVSTPDGALAPSSVGGPAATHPTVLQARPGTEDGLGTSPRPPYPGGSPQEDEAEHPSLLPGPRTSLLPQPVPLEPGELLPSPLHKLPRDPGELQRPLPTVQDELTAADPHMQRTGFLKPEFEPHQGPADSGLVSESPWPGGLVTLEHDESLWNICERHYGTGVFFRALYEHNRHVLPRPDRLPAGLQIDVPPRDELLRLYPQWCPKPEDLDELLEEPPTDSSRLESRREQAER